MGRARTCRKSSTSTVLVAKGSGPVKRTQINPYDINGSDDAYYEVAEILGERKSYGVEQFLIRWLKDGVLLAKESDTWEPVDNIPGHDAEIDAFREAYAEKIAVEEKKRSMNT